MNTLLCHMHLSQACCGDGRTRVGSLRRWQLASKWRWRHRQRQQQRPGRTNHLDAVGAPLVIVGLPALHPGLTPEQRQQELLAADLLTAAGHAPPLRVPKGSSREDDAR